MASCSLTAACSSPVPFRAALGEGATHVLVLRSRHERWRAVERPTMVERALGRAHPALAPALVTCHARYNADAEALARGDHPNVVQVAPPAGARLVGRFSTDGPRIAHSVALGAACMARLLASDRAPAPRRVPFPAVPGARAVCRGPGLRALIRARGAAPRRTRSRAAPAARRR